MRPVAGKTLAVTVLLLLAIYAGDAVRVRSARGGASDGEALGSVTFYYAVTLKSGRTEVYYDQPQTEICVRSLFPHFGYRPCWYAARERFHQG